MILIGSRALALRSPIALRREPKDFDFVCHKDEYDAWLINNGAKMGTKKVYSPDNNPNKIVVEGDSICEFDIIQPKSSNSMLESILNNSPDTLHTSFGMIPNLDLLFTIKDSHKYKKFHTNNHFWKTTYDWHIMQSLGAKVREEYIDFSKLRQKETYTNKLPNLNQGKSAFFSDDKIKYTYDHDDIHVSVADNYYPGAAPAYESYLKDGEEVMSDRNKFFKLDNCFRWRGVIEESCVLAIERSLIPFPNSKTPGQAFMYGLSKVCTSITSGWFRQFAFENIYDIIKFYKTTYSEYWTVFNNDVANNKVKKIDAKP